MTEFEKVQELCNESTTRMLGIELIRILLRDMDPYNSQRILLDMELSMWLKVMDMEDEIAHKIRLIRIKHGEIE